FGAAEFHAVRSLRSQKAGQHLAPFRGQYIVEIIARYLAARIEDVTEQGFLRPAADAGKIGTNGVALALHLMANEAVLGEQVGATAAVAGDRQGSLVLANHFLAVGGNAF